MTEIRRARPSDARPIAQVHVAAWRSTYAGILPDRSLTGLSCTDCATGKNSVDNATEFVVRQHRVVDQQAGAPAQHAQSPVRRGVPMRGVGGIDHRPPVPLNPVANTAARMMQHRRPHRHAAA